MPVHSAEFGAEALNAYPFSGRHVFYVLRKVHSTICDDESFSVHSENLVLLIKIILASFQHLELYQHLFRSVNINPLNTKRRPLYFKTQFVPRSKHFSSRL